MQLSTNRFIMKAVAIIAIQLQLLAFSSIATARALLSMGIIMELLAMLLALCVVHSHNFNAVQYPRSPSTLVLQIPTVLTLMGILGLGVALIVETLKTSLGTAVVMSGFLFLGVILCLLTLLRDPTKVEDGEGNSGHGCDSS